MKRALLIFAAWCWLSSPALAQFVIGGSAGTGIPGGTNGQIQYNNSGAFGGYTQSGDCSTNTSTGVITCLSLNGVAPGTFYPKNYSTALFADVGGTLSPSAPIADCASGTGDCTGGAILATMGGYTIKLGAHAYTIAQAGTGSFIAGFGACMVNGGATSATVTATTSTWTGGGGTTVLTLVAGASACFGVDGGNYLVGVAVGQNAAGLTTGVLPTSAMPATPLASGTSVSLTAPRQYYICTSTCTVTPPVPAAGYEFCVMNGDNVATAITLAALGSSAMYENTARTAYGTAGTGTLVSTAAAANKVCIVGLDSTHYLTVSFTGSWTAS